MSDTDVKLAFVDCETTGLDPARHEIYELAIITGDAEHRWWIRPNLETADPTALRISNYYQRRDWETNQHVFSQWDGEKQQWRGTGYAPVHIATLLAGAHIVGAVPSFDAAFLEVFLRKHGEAPAWHYHLIDVEVLAAGKLGKAPPWDSEELSRELGVEPPTGDERHFALADARWAKRIFDTVLQSTKQKKA